VPSGCSGDDFIRVGLPSEWLWVGIVVCDVSIDGHRAVPSLPLGEDMQDRLHHGRYRLRAKFAPYAAKMV
jgi:hypothetical protein